MIEEIIYGLQTDGGHHKQYTLEVVLRMICEDEWVDKAKDYFKWEEGIPA